MTSYNHALARQFRASTIRIPGKSEDGACFQMRHPYSPAGTCHILALRPNTALAQKSPASEEAGRVDPVGSVAVAAGPDQREAVVALTLHQRRVDRGRKARIVELDREIFPLGLPRGLLPRRRRTRWRRRRCDSRALCRCPSRSRQTSAGGCPVTNIRNTTISR